MADLHEGILDHLLPLIDQSGAVEICDYGCGGGELLSDIADRRSGLKLTGIDYFSRFVPPGEESPEPTPFNRIDRESDEFTRLLENGRFDLIVSTFAVHHFRHPVRELRQLAKLVRPGGRVVLYDHCVDLDSEAAIAKGVQSLFGEYFAVLKGGYHKRHYTLDEMQDLMLAIPAEMIESEAFRIEQTPGECRTRGDYHLERNRKIQGMVESNSTEFWKSLWTPVLKLEEEVLARYGLDFSLLMRIVLKV